jgi:nucleotide-binding universal stress UspA family protein
MNNTDIGVLELLSGIAKYSNSEILVTHVSAKLREEDNIKQFFNQIPFKITYPKILYHNIKGTDVVISLKQLCAHIDIDLLVIVHRSAGFFKELFGTSLTHKMATQPTKPLLVFPCQAIQETLLLPIDQHF